MILIDFYYLNPNSDIWILYTDFKKLFFLFSWLNYIFKKIDYLLVTRFVYQLSDDLGVFNFFCDLNLN